MSAAFIAWGLTAVTVAAPATAVRDDSFLRLYAETRRFLGGRPERAAFTPDGASVLFLRAGRTSPVQSLFELEVSSGQTRELLSPHALLQGASERLSPEEKARLERQRISARGFTAFRLSEDGTKLVVVLSGKPYLVHRPELRVQRLDVGDAPAIDPQLSPDGKSLAFVQDHDLKVVDLNTGRLRRLTRGGSGTLTRGLAEFVAQEEMGRFSGYAWSPDSKWLAFEEADLSSVEQFHIPDLLHPERPVDGFRYPRPGKPNARVRVGIVGARGGAVRWLAWDAERYPYLATLKWPKRGPLSLVVQNRAQQEEAVLAADPKTGATRALWVERDQAWLNLDQNFPRWLEDGRGFLWRTERNGAPELELRDAQGARISTWVGPEHGWSEWVGLDEEGGWIYFTAAPTPPESVLMRARPGRAPERLQPAGEAIWTSAVLSKEGGRVLRTSTSLTAMPETEVVSAADGKRMAVLPSVAAEPPFMPKAEIRKVGPEEGFWATVIRPRNFKKGVKLPVIVEVYGGPHHLSVKQVMRENLLPQWLADQGFLVVKLDNRGTPHRGRTWERAIRGNFAGATLDDQVAALQALALEVPELDLSRVGIEGWSFGGYMSALAAMKRPDVYRAAVAGAPVVDWTDYDTHYTERYLGLPHENPDGYRQSSLLTHAAQLQRPLLLVHGTADDNVYFLHSLKLSEALFRAGRPHGFLPLSGLTHMVPDPEVTIRLWEQIARFFKETL
ncbi:MAG TPA: DPP IV N-terminal domain-containing protein [Myxococcaceae bacterium]|nr:DPP IV N-terminal domain-containing protein [Myxococcaceae bacterium]